MARALDAIRLQQWPDSADEVFDMRVPQDIECNPAVIHLAQEKSATPRHGTRSSNPSPDFDARPTERRTESPHAARVVRALGAIRLRQWPDSAEEVFESQVPGTSSSTPRSSALLKNLGDAPLRNPVLAFIP